MRIPNKITQAWLDKKGFQFIEHYSDTGWRAYFVTRRDKKRCTLIEAANGKRERVTSLRSDMLVRSYGAKGSGLSISTAPLYNQPTYGDVIWKIKTQC